MLLNLLQSLQSIKSTESHKELEAFPKINMIQASLQVTKYFFAIITNQAYQGGGHKLSEAVKLYE